MQVFILAAGQGTRLAPLTNDRPKCLVELLGMSLLDRQISVFRQYKLSDITIITGYKSEKLENTGYNTIKNEHYAHTNMVATLFCASDIIKETDDLIISYGDIVFEPRVLQSLLSCPSPVAVITDRQWEAYWAFRMAEPLNDAETFKTDGSGKLIELGKKPVSRDDIQGQYIGLLKVRKDYIAKMKALYYSMDRSIKYDSKDFPNMFMTSFIQYMIDSGWHVQAVPVNNGWLEIDTVSDLDLYHSLHREDRLKAFYHLSSSL